MVFEKDTFLGKQLEDMQRGVQRRAFGTGMLLGSLTGMIPLLLIPANIMKLDLHLAAIALAGGAGILRKVSGKVATKIAENSLERQSKLMEGVSTKRTPGTQKEFVEVVDYELAKGISVSASGPLEELTEGIDFLRPVVTNYAKGDRLGMRLGLIGSVAGYCAYFAIISGWQPAPLFAKNNAATSPAGTPAPTQAPAGP